MEQLKTCTKCGIEKPESCFGVDRKAASGYKFWCKECSVAANKKWRLENKEKSKELDKKYRTKNKEKIRIKNKRRYQNLTLDEKLKMLITTASKRKEYECSISPEYLKSIWEKQEGRCAYTKLPLTADANQLTTMSLDRIDSNVGYVESNVQLVCVVINKMKSNFTEDQFVGFCNLVAQNNSIKDYPESLALIP